MMMIGLRDETRVKHKRPIVRPRQKNNMKQFAKVRLTFITISYPNNFYHSKTLVEVVVAMSCFDSALNRKR